MPVRRSFILFLAVLTGLCTASSVPASAQGLFDFLFGRRSPLPPRASSYADPTDMPRGASPHAAAPGGDGRLTTFCVRLCDGRHFPVAQRGGATPVELCRAACPASATKVFSGRAIDNAVAADGTRYAGLNNAYVYRQRLVDDCTCNGKDAFGLVPLDVNTDPTLRPGDTVATSGGLMTYNGRGEGAAQFTPVDMAKMPKALRDKLSAVKVTPEAKTAAAPEQPAQDATTGIVERGFSTVHPDRHAQFAR